MPDEITNHSQSPSWKELQEFISKQTDKDRALIDYWFKLAAGVLGVLLIVVGAAIGFFGMKTLADAKSAAETAAQDAAKAKVKEILQEPRIQKLVEETAQQMFRSGAFRHAIELETAAQLKTAIPTEIRRTLPSNITNELTRLSLSPRTVNGNTARDFGHRLGAFAGDQVEIEACPDPEPNRFAKRLQAILEGARLRVVWHSYPELCLSELGETLIGTIAGPQTPRRQQLKEVVSDLIVQATGKPPAPTREPLEPTSYPGSALVLGVSKRVQ